MLKNLIFSDKELELILGGEHIVSTAILRSKTVYEGGYNQHSEVIQWLWIILEKFSPVCSVTLLYVCPFSHLSYLLVYPFIYVTVHLFISLFIHLSIDRKSSVLYYNSQLEHQMFPFIVNGISKYRNLPRTLPTCLRLRPVHVFSIYLSTLHKRNWKKN